MTLHHQSVRLTSPAHLRIWLQEVHQYIEKQISKSMISISDLAYEFAMSERQLQRKIRMVTGLSPSEFIRTIRLQQARELIDQGHCATVQQVAYAVGYKRADYFSNLFEQHYGLKPIQLLRMS